MTLPRETTASRKKSARPRGYIIDYNPRTETRRLLTAVEAVLHEYRQHWPLTVRQVFYRLIGAHGFDKSEAFYGKLCHHLANARRAGVVPFGAIRDDGVTTVRMEHYADADAFLIEQRRRASRYRRDLMAMQPLHVEVWCEAAGMIHQLADVAHRYSINVYSSSGFDSLTAKKLIADRICDIGKPAVILLLDPDRLADGEIAGEQERETLTRLLIEAGQ